jgi:hypothetical protein
LSVNIVLDPDRDDLEVANIIFSKTETQRPSCFLTPAAPEYSPWGSDIEVKENVESQSGPDEVSDPENEKPFPEEREETSLIVLN